jgi:hypothetical protein
MTRRYIVRKYNDLIKAWSIYDTTFCQVDAIAMAYALQAQGFKSTVTQEIVND